ncbi:hypothetical protein EXB91_27780 [Salmonella enterica subsp. enterica serovar Florida]|nr:hypothetical protein [Salmonella enterica]ECG3787380.1 hypothetical protein [Salmonella enterica subsp. enterica serovar Florida]HAF2377134.1 hypothetical protein [Salmonella enterica]
MDKYLINLNSVDYTELPATSKRALFPHASSLIFMMTQKRHHPALASRARARFAIQKDEIRPFDTNQYLAIQKDDGNFHHLNNQHLAPLSLVLSPCPRRGVILQKTAILQ